MRSSVERDVRDFYNEYGWSKGGEDDRFRQFRPAYRPYHNGAIARTLGCFSGRGGSLLIVGGGDLPESHVELASRFSSVTCIDISEVALNITRSKLPNAKTVLGSICEAPLETGAFDAVFAAHIIYHIDANEQQRAVTEMIRVTKPGGRIVVLYNNPMSPIRFAAGALHRLRKRVAPEHAVNDGGPKLYFSPHKLGWWKQFTAQCSLSMQPWEIIGSYEERTLIGSDGLARGFYRAASWVERKLPSVSVRLWQYPIVILDRK